MSTESIAGAAPNASAQAAMTSEEIEMDLFAISAAIGRLNQANAEELGKYASHIDALEWGMRSLWTVADRNRKHEAA